MEFLIPSGFFFLLSMYLFYKPTKIKTQISEEDAESYFFNKSEKSPSRTINGTYTHGLAFYKNKKEETYAVSQSKPCSLNIL